MGMIGPKDFLGNIQGAHKAGFRLGIAALGVEKIPQVAQGAGHFRMFAAVDRFLDFQHPFVKRFSLSEFTLFDVKRGQVHQGIGHFQMPGTEMFFQDAQPPDKMPFSIAVIPL